MLVRGRFALAAVGALALTLVALPLPAEAAPPGAVTLPVAPDPSAIVTPGVVGATTGRLLLFARNWTGTSFWTGTTSLARVPGIPAVSLIGRVGLVGDTAVWGTGSAGAFVVHRLDLTTGTETTEDAGVDQFFAAGPTGWIGADGANIVFRDGATRRVLVSDSTSLAQIRAQVDATSALVTYAQAPGLLRTVLVDLSTFATTEVTTGVSSADKAVLTPSSVVWAAGATLSRRNRATGAVTTLPLPTSVITQFAATDSGAAFKNVATGGLVVLPADGSGQVAVTALSSPADVDARGDAFVVTASTSGTGPAVYTVTAAGVVSRLVDVPAAPERPTGIVLDAGRVAYAGNTAKGPGRLLPVRRVRTISGDVTLTAGAESVSVDEGVGVALSGTRTTAMTLDVATPLDLRDRGTRTGAVNASRAKLSGPYAVVDGQLPYRASGARVALPAADGTPLTADVYGSRFAYITVAGAVRLLDATTPLSATNPRTLGTAGCAGATCSPVVAVAADTVAWSTTTGGTALDLATGVTRPLGAPPRVAADGAVVLGTTVVQALDVVTGSTATIGASAPAGPVAADDHRVAWTGADGAVSVARLPFGTAHRPRLLGVVARSAFSPNGDGSADTWAPLLDFSKPLGPVTLTIRSGSTVVRTLSGTGALGSVRDLVWDGTTGAGTAAPDGTYTWTLTGDAADGEGPLAAIDGTGAVTGTVVVDRVKETGTVSLPASSALVRTTDGIPVSWSRTSAASTAPTVFDVRQRSVRWDFDRNVVVYDVSQTVRTGTTSTSTVVPGTSVFPGEQVQFSVRLRDAAGNVGAWSPWRAGSRSLDDRNLDRTFGPWSSWSSSGSFLGTVTTSTSIEAALNGDVLGSRIYVWATTCPTCGRLVVGLSDTLGESRQFTVDTRSATTRRHVLVLDKAVPRRDWFVELRPDGTPGRPRVVVDAVGSAF